MFNEGKEEGELSNEELETYKAHKKEEETKELHKRLAREKLGLKEDDTSFVRNWNSIWELGDDDDIYTFKTRMDNEEYLEVLKKLRDAGIKTDINLVFALSEEKAFDSAYIDSLVETQKNGTTVDSDYIYGNKAA